MQGVAIVAQLSLSLRLPAGRSREIVASFNTLARRARCGIGCTSATVYAGAEDPHRLFLRMEWSGDDALGGYVKSDDFSQLLTLIEMAAEPPAIEFTVAGQTRGLEYAAEVRGAS